MLCCCWYWYCCWWYYNRIKKKKEEDYTKKRENNNAIKYLFLLLNVMTWFRICLPQFGSSSIPTPSSPFCRLLHQLHRWEGYWSIVVDPLVVGSAPHQYCDHHWLLNHHYYYNSNFRGQPSLAVFVDCSFSVYYVPTKTVFLHEWGLKYSNSDYMDCHLTVGNNTQV